MFNEIQWFFNGFFCSKTMEKRQQRVKSCCVPLRWYLLFVTIYIYMDVCVCVCVMWLNNVNAAFGPCLFLIVNRGLWVDHVVQCWSSWRPRRLRAAGCHPLLLSYPCVWKSPGNWSQNHWMGPSPWNWREGPCRPYCGLLVPKCGTGSWSKLLQLRSPLPLPQRFRLITPLSLHQKWHFNIKAKPHSRGLSFPTDNSANIQGVWGPWSDWSPCPALCGQLGVQLRSRNCQSHSTPCIGPKLEGKECNGPECPKSGKLDLVWSHRKFLCWTHLIESDPNLTHQI